MTTVDRTVGATAAADTPIPNDTFYTPLIAAFTNIENELAELAASLPNLDPLPDAAVELAGLADLGGLLDFGVLF